MWYDDTGVNKVGIVSGFFTHDSLLPNIRQFILLLIALIGFLISHDKESHYQLHQSHLSLLRSTGLLH